MTAPHRSVSWRPPASRRNSLGDIRDDEALTARSALSAGSVASDSFDRGDFDNLDVDMEDAYSVSSDSLGMHLAPVPTAIAPAFARE